MTDAWLTFDPVFDKTLILSIAGILTIGFVWLEWKKNYRFQILRCLAQIILVLSIVCLFLRPHTRTQYTEGETILLTPNYSPIQADSLMALYPNSKVERLPQAHAHKNTAIIDGHQLDESLKNVRFVLGDGLSRATLDGIGETNFTFLSGSSPEGIASLSFEEHPLVNHTATLNGTVTGSSIKKITLEGPGGKEDSTTLGSNGLFQIKFKPKQAGKFLYSLVLRGEKNEQLETQTLPVVVRAERKLRIAIFQDYPTAEVRYLKNFLGEHGHAITLRYQLSRNIYRHEFANKPEKKIQRLDENTLEGLDLILMDTDVLQTIAAGERATLKKAIRSGLGLIILFNDLPGKSKSLREILDVSFESLKSDTARVTLGETSVMLRTFSENAKPQNGLVPLLQTKKQKIISGYSFSGAGKIGFQLATETFRYINEGKQDVYTALWSPLFEKTARQKHNAFQINILTAEPIYVDEPVTVEVISATDTPSLLADSTTIPLAEDVLIDNRYADKTWFKKTGWHILIIPEDSTRVDLYVHEKNDWSAVRVNNQHQINTIAQGGQTTRSSIESVVYQPVSPIIFFLMFLIAAGFLWVAPKVN